MYCKMIIFSRLPSRLSDTMTPPVIMMESDEENGDVDEIIDDMDSNNESDIGEGSDAEEEKAGDTAEYDDNELQNIGSKLFSLAYQNIGESDISTNMDEGETDESSECNSEEEDMSALLREAEKILADSGLYEPNTDSTTGGTGPENVASLELVNVEGMQNEGDDNHGIDVHEEFSSMELTNGQPSSNSDIQEGDLSLGTESQSGHLSMGTGTQSGDLHLGIGAGVNLHLGTGTQSGNLHMGKTFTVEAFLRKVDVVVPDVVTEEWIGSLPVLSPVVDVWDRIAEVLGGLQERLDKGDPAEEYKVSNTNYKA